MRRMTISRDVSQQVLVTNMCRTTKPRDVVKTDLVGHPFDDELDFARHTGVGGSQRAVQELASLLRAARAL